MLFTANKMSKLGEQFNRFYRVGQRQTSATLKTPAHWLKCVRLCANIGPGGFRLFPLLCE